MSEDRAEDFTGGQFQNISTDASKKLLRKHQEDEWTAVNKQQEGYCYVCLKRDWCIATILDVCYGCATRRGAEPILKYIKRKEWGFCDIHGGYSELEYKYNIAKINARTCLRCTRKMAEKYSEVKKAGVANVDPFWKSMRKKLGQDYMLLGSGLGESLRR